MYYRGYLEPIACPLCETLNNRVREECRYCGCPLENYCSDDACGTLNIPAARFCKSCGRPTLFLKAKVFDEELREKKTREALIHYLINGDPDTPAAKGIPDFYDPDDLPDLPLDPEYIPYY